MTNDKHTNASKSADVLKIARGSRAHESRALAGEVPIAISFNGQSYAVMMASPTDLHDFAVGFGVAEAIVGGPDEISDVEIAEVEKGMIIRMDIPASRAGALSARARNMVGQSGCGICGVEDIEAAVRPLNPVTHHPRIGADAIFTALGALGDHQPLNSATGAAHGAAFCDGDGAIQMLREDVGRHNALDKLTGALLRAHIKPQDGFVLMTSRCSYELVQKAVTAGFGLMACISAPTTLAVNLAREYGLTLVALARADSMLVLNDPAGVFEEPSVEGAGSV